VIRVVVSDLHRHLDLNLGFHDFTIETVLISSIDRSPLRPTLARPLFGDRIDVSNEWILYRGVSVKALIRVDLSWPGYFSRSAESGMCIRDSPEGPANQLSPRNPHVLEFVLIGPEIGTRFWQVP
jgi:hypothetical protein